MASKRYPLIRSYAGAGVLTLEGMMNPRAVIGYPRLLLGKFVMI